VLVAPVAAVEVDGFAEDFPGVLMDDCTGLRSGRAGKPWDQLTVIVNRNRLSASCDHAGDQRHDPRCIAVRAQRFGEFPTTDTAGQVKPSPTQPEH
jgi:hypothetical protein